MNLQRLHNVYLIGIGGIGMSALARYFKQQGKNIAGYDRSPSPLIEQLIEEGMHVHFDETPGSIPDDFKQSSGNVLVIRTPAVPTTSPLLQFWRERGAMIKKRSEVLGTITREQVTLAVAGTHGKTTVSSMLAHLLHKGGVPVNAFLGGIAMNYGTNVLFDEGASHCVVEADEFDRSFLQLHPNDVIITSLDADHLDIYGDREQMVSSYRTFADRTMGQLLVRHGLEKDLRAPAGTLTYAIDPPADVHARNVHIDSGRYHFDIQHPGGTIRGVELGMPGRHNVENAIAAAYLAMRSGVGEQGLVDGLRSFEGVQRRFNILINAPDRALVDDYAHHPQELKAAIGSVRELFPRRHLTVVFQPHLFSRTRDFAGDFAEVLAQADRLILLEIYPARELPIPDINAAWLMEQVNTTSKQLVERDKLPSVLDHADTDVVLMAGAGDIDRLVPVVYAMMKERSKAR